jgi:hypothetical protein
MGKWNIVGNVLYNSLAGPLFITSMALGLLPVFLGKLPLISDTLSSVFFRPFAKMSLSIFVVHMFVIYYI